MVVRSAYTWRVFSQPEFKVLWSIVAAPTILVMHMLVWSQKASDGFFHDKNVFKDVAALVSAWVVGGFYFPVTGIYFPPSAFPVVRMATIALGIQASSATTRACFWATIFTLLKWLMAYRAELRESVSFFHTGIITQTPCLCWSCNT